MGTGLRFRDTQCGFKAFRTPVARLLFHLVRIDRFAFDVEILARAQRLGLRIAEVPVQWRHVPGSTIHPLHDSISMLDDVYRSRLGLVPTPPITTVLVGGRPGAADTAPLAAEIGAVVAATLEGTPVPVIAGPTAVTVLLPLVDRGPGRRCPVGAAGRVRPARRPSPGGDPCHLVRARPAGRPARAVVLNGPACAGLWRRAGAPRGCWTRASTPGMFFETTNDENAPSYQQ